MLLSHEYGLHTSLTNRDQLYYYKLEESTDSYFFYLGSVVLYKAQNYLIDFFYNVEGLTLYSLYYNYFNLSNVYSGAFYSQNFSTLNN
jgi:hypothetical protein